VFVDRQTQGREILYSWQYASGLNFVFGFGLLWSVVWFLFFLENFAEFAHFGTTRLYDTFSLVVIAVWVSAFLIYNIKRYRYIINTNYYGKIKYFISLVLPLILPSILVCGYYSDFVAETAIFQMHYN